MEPKTAPETKVTKKDEADYYKEAASWDEDRIIALQKSKRTAWMVAGAAATLSLGLTLGLVLLIPLKTVEPFMVRVDASTGIVDQVVKLKDARESYDEVMTKFFLRRVVALRETYTRAQLQSNYDQSVLFTAPSARPQLKVDFSFDNVNGPYKRYGELGTSSVQIVNISFVAKNVAQVRYMRADRKGGAETQTRWVATVEFRYVSQPASEEARGINPLGFQVTNYRNDPEAVVEGNKS
jgi:type IV secretion system protein VirB8